MKLICGLGNPGEAYENTRHNAGFLWVDSFAREMEFPEFKSKWKSLYSEMGAGNEKIILLKPQTYMNLSGPELKQWMDFYKISPEDILVVYDDVDIPLGEFRYREKGSAGTHNGMGSIVELLATGDFPRLRLGIESRGQSAPELQSLHDFVLSPFLEEEKSIFFNSVQESIKEIKKKLA